MEMLPWELVEVILDFGVRHDIDVFLIAQTNRRLWEVVEAKICKTQPYRRRLFYNLNIFNLKVITIPILKWYQRECRKPIDGKLVIHTAECGVNLLTFLHATQMISPSNISFWFWGSQMIRAAIKGEQHDIIRFLLNTIDKENYWPCAEAARTGNREILDMLIEAGCRLICCVVDWAAVGGHIEMIKYLLSKGQQLNLSSTLTCAIQGGSIETVHWLREQQGLNSFPVLMSHVLLSGSLPMLLYWLKEYPDLQFLPHHLSYAILCGNIDVIRYMICECGCRVTQYDLEEAAKIYDAVIFELLISHYHAPNGAPNGGLTLSMMRNAIITGNLDIIMMLRNRGCPWYKNLSCLIAVMHNHSELAEILKDLGAVDGE